MALSNKTTSSAPQILLKSFSWVSNKSTFGISEYTICDHALYSVSSHIEVAKHLILKLNKYKAQIVEVTNDSLCRFALHKGSSLHKLALPVLLSHQIHFMNQYKNARIGRTTFHCFHNSNKQGDVIWQISRINVCLMKIKKSKRIKQMLSPNTYIKTSTFLKMVSLSK